MAGLNRHQTYAGETPLRHLFRLLAWCMAFWMTLSGEEGACFGRVQPMIMILFTLFRPQSGGVPNQALHRTTAQLVSSEFGGVGRAAVGELWRSPSPA